MTNGHAAGIARGFQALWGSGRVGGLSDGQLVARFVERRHDGEGDGTGEDASAALAFEVLVERHGPMVLRVARDILRDPHSAQDVFQATFLVLARRAGSISRPEALAPWLYGVAQRVARKARVEADRRRRHEARAADRAWNAAEAGRPSMAVDLALDLGSTLHDEVARLPEPCRVAVVLCYFEGLTYDQAARHLGVTEATVRGRLARSRRVLRGRLTARGATAWSLPIVPDRWIGPTARLASRFARVGVQASPTSPAVGLAEGVLRTMIVSKLKAAAVLAAFQIVAVAGVLAQQPQPQPQPQPATTPPQQQASTDQAQPQAPPKAEAAPIAIATDPGLIDKRASIALTLDQAIHRLLGEDHELAGRFVAIPQAKRDWLATRIQFPRSHAVAVTTGRGKNRSVIFVDRKLEPAVQAEPIRPSGPTLYDVNVSSPLDFSKKRNARISLITRADSQPVRVEEAQFLDASRLRVEALALAFGEALASRDLARLRLESVERLDRLNELARDRNEDLARLLELTQAQAALARKLQEVQDSMTRATRVVASMVKLAEGTDLEVIGELGRVSGIASMDSLVDQAITARPDLAAFRLGVARARADLRLHANSRYQWFQPSLGITIPMGPKNATACLLAMAQPTFSYENLEIFQRAKLNVLQSEVELTAVERELTTVEVKQAHHEAETSREAVDLANEQATVTRYASETARARYQKGTQTLANVMAAADLADEAAKTRVEVLARHYRARVGLNRAVGRMVVQP